MEDLHQQICDSQKALLARVHDVQSLFLDGFEKIVNLNLQAVRGRLDDAAGRVKSSGMQPGLPDPLAQFAHRLQHQFDRNLAYGHQLGEILKGLQSGLRELTLTELDGIGHTAVTAPSRVRPAAKSAVRRKAQPAVQAVRTHEAGKGRKKSQPAVVSAPADAAKARSRTGRKTAATAGKKTHEAVPQATTVPEAPKAVPAAPSIEAAMPRPAAEPAAPAGIAATAMQPPANVIGHLVAQTAPEDSDKEAPRS